MGFGNNWDWGSKGSNFNFQKRLLQMYADCCAVVIVQPIPPVGLPLILTFNDINNTGIVADPSNVSEWNGALVVSGTAYTTAVVNGNSVELYGGSNVELSAVFAGTTELLAIDDQALSVVTIPVQAFYQAAVLGSVKLNAATSIPDIAFALCSVPMTVEVNSATVLGFQSFQFSPLISISATSCLEIGQQSMNACANLANANFPICTIVRVSGLQGAGITSGLTINIPLLEECEDNAFAGSGIQDDFNLNLTNLTICASGVFSDCPYITTFTAPVLTESGSQLLTNWLSLITVYTPLCTNFGGTVGDDGIFTNITGQVTTITVPILLQTCNAGGPDGDLVYLAANNTATIIYV